jgi:lipoyl(octanoyl) transferase
MLGKNLPPRERICLLEDYGLIDYQKSWNQQKLKVRERLQNPDLPDTLILVEHPPVYTLGTGANPNFIKFDLQNSSYEVYHIERGGEVTYHCPGQIVGYPILNLSHYQKDLHWYLRQLEEVIIRLLKIYDLDAYRLEGLTGVWVKEHKLAAIGIKVKRWITMHGFALNVCPDLSGFQRIIPCGITNKPVGSMSQFIPNLSFLEVKQDLIKVFMQVFETELLPISRKKSISEK